MRARSASLIAWSVALTTACTPRTSATGSRERAATPSTVVILAPAAEEVVTRTSEERRALGLRLLARNEALMRAAQLHADQMAASRTMAHEIPGAPLPTLASRLSAVGYRMRASGENIAEGYPTPTAVVAGWMTSPGHRANIVSTNFTEMGAGIATSTNGRRFYVQVFAAPR